MDKKEMTRSNVGALEGSSGEAFSETASNAQFITSSGAGQSVSLLLLRGEANAIPARMLCKLCGFNDTRFLRRAIERERAAGVLILSGDRGYYLPDSNPATARREIERFVRRTDARLRSNRRSIQGCKRFLRSMERGELEGQVSMAGGEDDV